MVTCRHIVRSGRLFPEIRVEPPLIGFTVVSEIKLYMDGLGTLAAHRKGKLGFKSLKRHEAGFPDVQFGHAADPGSALGNIRQRHIRP